LKHDGTPPQSYAQKQAFKKSIEAMKRKTDEENFDEAIAQAYRSWTPTIVPSDIAALFSEPELQQPRSSSLPNVAIFFHLLAALHRFTQQPPYTLPLSSTLPDMKSDTNSYIHLQNLYKRQADQEKEVFKGLIGKELSVDNETVDEFVKNTHGLRLLRGKPFGAINADREALGKLSLRMQQILLINYII
jgi:NEDD8-activating enzyme E1 regulatory subunit